MLIWLLLIADGSQAREVALTDADAQLLRLSAARPPCSEPPAGLPLVPADPAVLVTRSGTRCYGTRPGEQQLWLMPDRTVWLERQAPHPLAWIQLGGVVVDPLALEPAPLGLRLTRSDDADSAGRSWILETRHRDRATLTPVHDATWQPVTAPDGSRFWARLGQTGRDVRVMSEGRVRLRAD